MVKRWRASVNMLLPIFPNWISCEDAQFGAVFFIACGFTAKTIDKVNKRRSYH